MFSKAPRVAVPIFEPVAGAGHDAVGDGDVLGDRDIAAVGIFALEAYAVVAADNVAVGDEDIAAGGDVHAVSIDANVGITDSDCVDDDALAVNGAECPACRVLERDSADTNIAALRNLHHGGGTIVVVDCVIVPGSHVAVSAVRRDRAVFQIMFPIRLTLAVDGSEAADGEVVRVLREDEVITVGIAPLHRTCMVGIVANGWTA